jgi:hypothetical protein
MSVNKKRGKIFLEEKEKIFGSIDLLTCHLDEALEESKDLAESFRSETSSSKERFNDSLEVLKRHGIISF